MSGLIGRVDSPPPAREGDSGLGSAGLLMLFWGSTFEVDSKPDGILASIGLVYSWFSGTGIFVVLDIKALSVPFSG